MPVSEQVRVDTHTGNGVTTNFAYNFKIFADTDLQVVVDGVLQTLTTHYTVNGVGDDGGGSIDFITAPINLSVVTISGELAYERNTDYIENGALRSETVDDDFDRTTMLVQQNRRDIRRSIKLPIEETDDQEVSFTPANRADKVLAFDALGLPTALSLTDLTSILTAIDTSLVLASGILSVAIPTRQCVAGGTADAITGVTVPVAGALTNNLRVTFEASGANTITTPTFDLDGLGAKDIVKGSDFALRAGDIPGANARVDLIFDASLDKWVYLNPALMEDAADKAIIQSGGYLYALTTGAADAYELALSPTVSAYTEGMVFVAKIHAAALTTTPTLNLDTIGVKTIKRENAGALLVGDLPINYKAVFMYTGANLVLLNPALVKNHNHTGVTDGGVAKEHTLLQNLWFMDANFARNPDFETDSVWTKTSGWTIAGGVASHSSGTTDLSQDGILDQDSVGYRVTFTVSNRTAGSITPKIGATAGTSRSADGVFTEIITSPGSGQPHNLIFTPTTDFDGDITRVVVQRNNGTTTIPDDSTWPQITEGDEYITGEVTCADATDIIEIEVRMSGEHSNVTFTKAAIALFKDAVAAALTADVFGALAPRPHSKTIKWRLVAGTTSQIVFRLRAGGTNTGTYTLQRDIGGAENIFMNIKVFKGA